MFIKVVLYVAGELKGECDNLTFLHFTATHLQNSSLWHHLARFLHLPTADN